MKLLERMGVQSNNGNSSIHQQISQANSLQSSPNKRYSQLMDDFGDDTVDETATKLRLGGGNGYNQDFFFHKTNFRQLNINSNFKSSGKQGS